MNLLKGEVFACLVVICGTVLCLKWGDSVAMKFVVGGMIVWIIWLNAK